ncbi:MAG: tetratricopeptide repeat protein [Fibrobacter sp.]|nr:tetratricopeptide repeat protein [Fibrobacter sp.]
MQNAGTFTEDKFAEDNSKAEESIAAGDYPEAARILVKIVENDPLNSRAYNNLGVISWIRSFWMDAYVMFKKSIECNPVYEDALHNLFDASLKLKKVNEIIPCFENALILNPYLDEIKEVLEIIKTSGDSIYCSQRALAIGIYNPICDEAEKELNSGNLPKAAELFLKVIDTQGPDARSFCGLGIIAYNQQNYSDAFALFIESIKLNPVDTDTYLNLLDAALQCNKLEVALDLYKSNKQLYPNLEQISEKFNNAANMQF